MNKISNSKLLVLSLMIFSMFFGAGNLILPPSLGNLAGTNLKLGLLGFLISAVTLPILSIAAVAKSGGLYNLSQRVHPKFALFFTMVIYLAIGPFLGIPRAASLAFEMGVMPFMPEGFLSAKALLFIYTLVYFSVAYWLSMSPTKLPNRLGKILTPIILTLIGVVFIFSFSMPKAAVLESFEGYKSNPMSTGFLEGYLTMDAIAGLNFGIVITLVLKEFGLKKEKDIVRTSISAGIIAGALLTIIYIILAYLGSVSGVDPMSGKNGAEILTIIVINMFGPFGAVVLGVIFSLACLTTSVGLLTSCSEYFSRIMPKINYKTWVRLISLTSMFFANFGLNKILEISVVALSLIYPIAIVLIIFGLIHNYIKSNNKIYLYGVGFTAVFSILEFIDKNIFELVFLEKLPLYSLGIGFIFPCVIGVLISYIFYFMNKEKARIN
ncbi:MAG: branched-chain amino acid transport system II carrier protein [Clostridium sp.]|nr:branched-chain amino acid transport system II carrier protein [Clostridium sp.]